MKNLYLTIFLAFLALSSAKATVMHTVLPNNGLVVPAGGFQQLTVDATDFGFEYDPTLTGIWIFDAAFNDPYVLTNGFDDLRLFASGDTLNQSVAINVDGTTAFSHQPGNEPAGVHYVGLKSANGNFAWVKIDVNPGTSYTILEYAYEDNGGPIVAGSTSSVSGVGLEETISLQVEVLQNVEDKSLSLKIQEGEFQVALFDISGRNVFKARNQDYINIDAFKTGVYSLLVEAHGKAIRKKILIL